jgi:enediyne biosynthesis protein E4
MRLFHLIILLASVACMQNGHEKGHTAPSTLFELLDSTGTGIDFINEVRDEEKLNVLTYRNFYNGGGVGIGDINNDSLPDIYLTSNQKENKLFLNKGSFKFEDITTRAGVGGTKAWSTGVVMADVNADGFLDIYVCNSGDFEGKDRENELFINNGDLTFSERAKEFNLNNEGYSTHAAFFDYDGDNDLDCYILNNSFKDPGKIELYRKVREIPDPGGDKLMRNDGGIFTDVTTQAGIFSSDIGFGLGVAISDVNNDYLPDIYVSNDFWERDYLFINKGKGNFSEELISRIDYCSVSSMGSDIADLNNDGSPEIFTTDMLPADNYRLKTTIAFDPYHLEDLKYRSNFHYQIVQNCLHLNNGRGRFQEIAMMAGVAATDWSWGALIFDFENDGNKDIFVSNGIQKDIMSMDFRDFIADSQKRKEIIDQKGRFDHRDFISLMPSNPLANYAFQHSGNLVFENRADSLGLGQKSFSNGSAYGDLDNDGDLDLVVNNINSPSFVYRNNAGKKSSNHFLKVKFKGPGKNQFGIGAQVFIKSQGLIKTWQNFNSRGFESSVEPHVLFGLGNLQRVDTLKVIWPDLKEQILTNLKVDQTLTIDYSNAVAPMPNNIKPQIKLYEDVTHMTLPANAKHSENIYNDFNDEILLPRMLSTEGPRLAVGDVNGDNLDDFILLGASGDPDKLFVQKSNGTFEFAPNKSFESDARFESTCAALFDQDNDGDLDLMIGSGGNETQVDRSNFVLRFYRNNGRGGFITDNKGLPQVVGNFSTLEVSDFDGDGDVDMFLGARSVPGNYGLPPRSFLFKNDPEGWFDVASSPLGNIGMVTDATWADVDSDKDPDLVVVGDWMAITIFKNNGGKLDQGVKIPYSSGWWNRIEPSDLDGDDDVDFVLGNWGLNSKFKASLSKPLTMFVNDFDGNGKSEFLINWYAPMDSQAFPFAPKSELTSQLPGLRRTILKYEDYSSMTYDSLFSSEVRQASIKYEANYLESAILWNDKGKLTLNALPFEAQVSPVFGILPKDLDDDGKKDIWLGGNFYALKPQVGRLGANHGVFLKGGGINSFAHAPMVGLLVDGEVRDVRSINPKGRSRILIGRNNTSALLFEKR